MKRLLALSLLASLITCQSVWAAPVCSNPQTNSVEADPMTISYTPAAGSNKYVFGAVHLRANTADITISAVTFDTIAMSSYGSVVMTDYNPAIRVYLYRLATTETAAKTFSVDFNVAPDGDPQHTTIAIWTCVDTADFRAAATTEGVFNQDPQSMTVSGATGDLFLDAATCQNCTTPTQGASQTQLYQVATGTTFSAQASYAAGAASLALEWDDQDGAPATNGWAHAGGSLMPAARRAIAPIMLP